MGKTDAILNYIKAEDRDFRLRSIVHPDMLRPDLYGAQLGEGIYTLYVSNLWPEISGLRVWQVSPTYWGAEWHATIYKS